MRISKKAYTTKVLTTSCLFYYLQTTQRAPARSQAITLLSQIQKHLFDNRRGEVIRSGIKMAIFGPPNAGKSSLFNFLGNHYSIAISLFNRPSQSTKSLLCIANRPASIVTPIPGTTRDVLELTLDIGGLPVVVADTAGLRETDDLVEGIGVQRGVEALVCLFFCFNARYFLRVHITSVKNADVALCVLPFPEVLVPPSSLSPHQLDIQIPLSIQPLITPHTNFLLNKSDLISHILPPTLSTASSFFVSPHPNAPPQEVNSTAHFKLIPSDASGSSFNSQAWSTSLVTNQGTHEFVQGLAEALKSQYVIHFPQIFLTVNFFM